MKNCCQIQNYDAPYNHHPVEDIEPDEIEQSKLGESLVRVIIWVISGVSTNGIAARALVLSECLGLNSQALTWAEVADNTELTRSAVQLMAKELEEQFGLRSANARNNETREKCKQAQIKLNK